MNELNIQPTRDFEQQEFNSTASACDKSKAKHEKSYTDLAKSIAYLKKFDWCDSTNPLIKLAPVKVLTPAAFWFIVCNEYFPRMLTIGGDPQKTLMECLSKIERYPTTQIIRVNEKTQIRFDGRLNDPWLTLFLLLITQQGLLLPSSHYGEGESGRQTTAMDSSKEQQEEILRTLQKAIKKSVNSCSGGKFALAAPTGKQIVELKSDYTPEDDAYIMEMRHQLISLFPLIADQFPAVEAAAAATTTTATIVADSSSIPTVNQLPVTQSSLLLGQQDTDSTTHNTDNEDSLASANATPNTKTNNSTPVRNCSNGIMESMATSSCMGSSCCPTKFSDEDILNAMKTQDLDDIIALLCMEERNQREELKYLVNELSDRIAVGSDSERFIYGGQSIDFQEPLVDIQLFNSVELEYLNFLQTKQQHTGILDAPKLPSSTTLVQEAHKNTQTGAAAAAAAAATAGSDANKDAIEDLACQVCNDGDYTDDDLIVFCAKCNVSVHQRCYGIPKIPDGDWVCDLCLGFGPNGQYLRCALCTQRGGAMKPSRIPISSGLFSQTNPDFYEFAKKCKQPPSNSNKKQRYEEPISIENEESACDGKGGQAQHQYYDFHSLPKLSSNDVDVSALEPEPHFVWCHITCALWTPECFFDDKNYYSNIKGLENIEKQRFKLECSICKKSKGGACVQCACAKCMEAFHPECARRANVFMEEKNSEKLSYLIYCERHTPLKLRRQLEHKFKKNKEEIIKFCRAVDRVRESALFKDKILKKTNSTTAAASIVRSSIAAAAAASTTPSTGKSKQNNNKTHSATNNHNSSNTKNSNSNINNNNSSSNTNNDIIKKEKSKPAVMTPKQLQQQLAFNAEQARKLDLEFQKLVAVKMIEYLDKNPPSVVEESIAENQDADKPFHESDNNTEHFATSQVQQQPSSAAPPQSKMSRWQNKVFLSKEHPFWTSFTFNEGECGVQLYRRYKVILKDEAKKKDFKLLYLRTLSSMKNIRIVTKEDRLREKEQKKKLKTTQKHEKLFSIFQKTTQKQQVVTPSPRVMKDPKLIEKKVQQKQIEEKPKREEKIVKPEEECKKHLQTKPEEKVEPKPEIQIETVVQPVCKTVEPVLVPVSIEVDVNAIVAEPAFVEPVYIVNQNYEAVNEESEAVFCVCRRKYLEGDQMMECEVCNEWYHLDCIGFIGTLDQAESIEFACKFCYAKEPSKAKRAIRRKAYSHLFINFDSPNYDQCSLKLNASSIAITPEKMAIEFEEIPASNPKKHETEKKKKKKDGSEKELKSSKKRKFKESGMMKSAADLLSTQKKQRTHVDSSENDLHGRQLQFSETQHDEDDISVYQESDDEEFTLPAKNNKTSTKSNNKIEFFSEEVNLLFDQKIKEKKSAVEVQQKPLVVLSSNEAIEVEEGDCKIIAEEEMCKENVHITTPTTIMKGKEARHSTYEAVQPHEQIERKSLSAPAPPTSNEITSINVQQNQGIEEMKPRVSQILTESTRKNSEILEAQLVNSVNSAAVAAAATATCSISNIDSFKLKQKSIKDFFRKK